MFDDLTDEQVKKIKQTLTFIKRFLYKLFPMVLFSAFIYYTPILLTFNMFDGFSVNIGYVIAGTVFTLFLFYSATRLVTVFNSEFIKRFLYSENPTSSVKDKLGFIFSQKENRHELIAFAVVYLFLPIKVACPGFAWLIAGDSAGFIAKLKVTAVLFPLLFVVYIFAHLSSIAYWDKQERQREMNKIAKSNRELEAEAKNDKRVFRKSYRTMFTAYFIGSLLMMFVIPPIIISFSPFLLILFDIKLLVLVAILFLMPGSYESQEHYLNAESSSKRYKNSAKKRNTSLE